MKKKFCSFIALLFFNFLFFFSFHLASAQANQQKLSDTAIIQNEENEKKSDEEDEQLTRKKYFENMHRTAAGVDWRKIESANALHSYQQLSTQKIQRVIMQTEICRVIGMNAAATTRQAELIWQSMILYQINCML